MAEHRAFTVQHGRVLEAVDRAFMNDLEQHLVCRRRDWFPGAAQRTLVGADPRELQG